MGRTSRQPSISASRARDRARHEAEILAAAERIFAREGYLAATMAEVASEAGFAIGTLYNLFGSKDAIFDRLHERHLEALANRIALAMAGAGTPRDKLEASVVARAQYLHEHRDFFLIYVNEIPGAHATPSERPPVNLFMKDQYARLEACFKELGSGLLDPAISALVFYGATRAYIVEDVLKAKHPLKLREVSAVVCALLDGLAPHG
jgi:AcrR family transcriptional regulator